MRKCDQDTGLSRERQVTGDRIESSFRYWCASVYGGRSVCAPPARFPAVYPPQNDVRIDHLVKIQMRDGVTLYADVYRPEADGKYPVLVSRTPYGTERFPSAYEEPLFFARRGYVFVYQDVRGRHESEGKWEPFRNDIEDGYDTVEWAAKQQLVERESRHARALLWGPCAMACRDGQTAASGNHLSTGRLH